MAIKKTTTPMREQDPKVRVKNFNEVATGYTEEDALEEAQRCLNCKNKPCVKGCPVNIDIPAFIMQIKEGNFQKAIDILHEKNCLPLVTGRVCPQEEQCQMFCSLSKIGDTVSIGRLERFAADWELKNKTEQAPPNFPKLGKKVAIIGSGPAGLSCAGDLVRFGYEVTIFEAFHKSGGVLVYGIPEFRLPKDIVETEVKNLNRMGVVTINDVLVGSGRKIQNLFDDGYSAIFIGTGAGLPQFMGIPGENLSGVYSANEYLTRVNLMKSYLFPRFDTPILPAKNVAVVGGGNVALDSARTALRLGADHVYMIYRRGREEMPARLEEVHHAEQEGVDFNFLTNPIAYFGNEKGYVCEIECQKMELCEPDASGRRRPVACAGSNFKLKIDQVIVSVGTTPNPIIAKTTPGLETQKKGEIVVNEVGMTSIPGVFAGGDIVTGAATVITAMGAGRIAAAAMHDYLSKL
jgi:glutamate synthase (NADPH/NADH) small chain